MKRRDTEDTEEAEGELTQRIIGAAIEVHQALGPGLLESAYQACLAPEFSLGHIAFEQQRALPVRYKGLQLDCGYRLDFVVADKVVVELKAIEALHPIRQAQVLTYLKLTGYRVGLLINFHVSLLKNGIKRIVLRSNMISQSLCSLCLCGLILLCFLSSCRQDMYNQPKAKPDSETEFFNDGTSARPIPPHTVQRGDAREDEAFYTGLTSEALVAQLPLRLTPELLSRGRGRFDIYCAICHGATGDGNGQVVQRGFPAPPSYRVDRLRNAPIGHFYDVITNGYGVMYSYASDLGPNDRWAIAAYIRALQLSQNARVRELPPNDRQRLEQTP